MALIVLEYRMINVVKIQTLNVSTNINLDRTPDAGDVTDEISVDLRRKTVLPAMYFSGVVHDSDQG